LFRRRFITSWTDSRPSQSERGALTIMFDKYINTTLFDAMKTKFKKITPVPENSHLQVRSGV
jgi:dynein heavy chain